MRETIEGSSILVESSGSALATGEPGGGRGPVVEPLDLALVEAADAEPRARHL
jgi:hypothetical protein